MFDTRIYRGSGFRFDEADSSRTHTDKMRGLAKWGPYRRVEAPPKVGFVFPSGYRDYANNLFLALKNGIGYFKGVTSLFKFEFAKEQVFPITDFELKNPHDHEEAAVRYRDAILRAKARGDSADIFINLHPKSLAWEEDSAYSACKATLLETGVISQNVTFELLDNASQFEWAAANIALQMFVKLGGIPWTTNLSAPKRQVVLGMGRAENVDPVSRMRTRFTAFTTCVRENGIYELTNIGKTCTTRAEYLNDLSSTVRESLKLAIERDAKTTGAVIHIPKDFSREEQSRIADIARQFISENLLEIHVLKVTEEERFFAFDDSTLGIPPRGTCIKLGSRDYMLYTEGVDEKAAWATRLPTALRLKHYAKEDEVVASDLIAQVFDLSLVNFRGFNAKAFPISVYYSHLIANVLKRGNSPKFATEMLKTKLWFL